MLLQAQFARQSVSFTEAKTEEREPVFEAYMSPPLSVADLIRGSSQNQLPMPLPVSYRLALQLLAIFDFWWQGRTGSLIEVCYPELHPAAVMVSPEGKALITHIHLGYPQSLTASVFQSQELWYLAYASPEETLAKLAIGEEHAFYRLGTLLFECLTGKSLFPLVSRKSIEEILDRKNRNIHPRISDIHPECEALDPFIHSLLSPQAESRRVDLLELQRLIRSLLEDKSTAHANPVVQYLDEMRARIRLRQHPGPDEESESALEILDIGDLNSS